MKRNGTVPNRSSLPTSPSGMKSTAILPPCPSAVVYSCAGGTSISIRAAALWVRIEYTQSKAKPQGEAEGSAGRRKT